MEISNRGVEKGMKGEAPFVPLVPLVVRALSREGKGGA
jgi:hypothetical protein